LPYTISLQYTPAAIGSDTLHVTFKDADGELPAAGVFDIALDITSSLQAAPDQNLPVTAGTNRPATPLCVLGNDVLNGQTVTITSTTSSRAVIKSAGSAFCAGQAYLDYTPANGFIGTDSFSYTISAAGNQTSNANVSVAVGGTISFQTNIYPTLSGTCTTCHGPAGSNTQFLPSGSASFSVFYAAFCGVTSGPCSNATYVDHTTPSQSLLYVRPRDGVSTMIAYPAFASDVLKWIEEGAYCKTDGTPCP
jgi:hypothetical protein